MKNKVYDLEDVALPRLAGRPLQLFAAAVESRVTGPALLRRLAQDGGFTKFRGLDIPEKPTQHPHAFAPSYEGVPPTTAELAARLEVIASGVEVEISDFQWPGVRDFAAAYRTGKTTPEAVFEGVMAAIGASDAHDPPLRAFIASDAADIRRQAAASAERHAAGRPLSLFDGVPVAVKDELDVAGYPTTVGTRFLGREVAAEDATIVARLRALGAIIIGKTNMHEIGISVTGINAHYGAARNPYNLGHITGGSSSGSAAAVAAGICPVAIGADGGGSIRIPAALCGVVGLKATYGRISGHGAAPLDWSVGHLGPIGASVADVALAYAAVAGVDAADPLTRYQPAFDMDGNFDVDVRGLTLGIYRPWFDHAEAEVVALCQAQVEALTAAGASVREVVIPELDALRLAHAVTILSEMATALEESYTAQHTALAADVRINVALGRYFTSRDYIKAQRMRTRAIRFFEAALEEADVLLTPTTGMAAPPISPDALPFGESNLTDVTRIMRFAWATNMTGHPALTVPVGYTAAGLPVGLQIMGRPWAEWLLLRLGWRVERGVVHRPPQLLYAPLDERR